MANRNRIDQEKIEKGVRLILQGLHVDLADRNYAGTPRRVAKMYAELFTPHPNNFRTFEEKHDSMIVLRGHEVHGMCPHHLLPVVMQVYLAYIPNGRVLGLSKLARTVEGQLTEPIMQETLTDRVVADLQRRVEPKGVACTIVGVHGCMRHRGVRTGGDIVTSAVSGIFLTNAAARDEFMKITGDL